MAGGRALLVDTDPLGSIAAALDLAHHSPIQSLAALGLDSEAPLWKNVLPGLDVTTPYGEPGKPHHLPDQFLGLLRSNQIANRYQWLIIDTPPVIGGMQLRELLQIADDLVIVVRTEPMAFRMLPELLGLVKSVREEGGAVKLCGILLTLPPGELLGGTWETELRKYFTRSILPQALQFDPEVGQAHLLHKPVLIAAPQSPAALQYAALAQHLGIIAADTESIDLFQVSSSG